MAYLYQQIKNVPGLSGSSYQRQKQYWDKLGLGSGYGGSYAQNMKLLNYLKKPNYGLSTPKPAPVAPAAPTASPTPNVDALVKKFAEAGGTAPTAPVFREVLPFEQAWGRFAPTYEQMGRGQINPYLDRQQAQQDRAYNLQQAGGGGWRFGRGGLGTIEADTERQRKSQMQDWMNLGRSGFQGTFYDPAEKAWTRGLELGKTKEELMGNIKMPTTWDQFQGQAPTGQMGQLIPQPPIQSAIPNIKTTNY